jgi:putative pyruvate formate lyase activating enzyme
MTSEMWIASAVLHKGEEPPLIGGQGSGAVFFSGCTLGCPFCQNVQLSCEGIGSGMTEAELSAVFIKLQESGASNINLVTATQFAPSIVGSVDNARAAGLKIPVMWNTSGYESSETLAMLDGTVDIWLPDMKTQSSALAGRLFGAPDYPVVSADALKVMAEQLEVRGGTLIEDGIMKRGMIVRHLVMPGELEASREVLEWFARNLKDKAMLSVMVQYTPVSDEEIAGMDYIMSEEEYNRLLEWVDELGIEEGFLQAPEAADKEWIPDFNRANPFPEKYSKPVWHWKEGYSK